MVRLLGLSITTLNLKHGFQFSVLRAFVFIATNILWLFYVIDTNYAPGKDGYWYVIQLQSLIDKGVLHSVETTLLYPLYRFLHFFFDSYTASFKATLICIHVFVSFCFSYLLDNIKRYFHDNFGNELPADEKTTSHLSILLYIMVWFSPTAVFLTVQYPKQNLALAFLYLGFAVLVTSVTRAKSVLNSIHNISENKLKIKKILGLIAAGFLFAIAALSHRFAAALIIFEVALFLMFYLISKRLQTKNRLWNYLIKRAAYAVGLVTLLIAILSVIPGALNLGDLQRLTDSFTSFYIPAFVHIQAFGWSPQIVIETCLAISTPIIAWKFISQYRKEQVYPYFVGITGCLFCYLLFTFLPLFSYSDLQVRLLTPGLFFSYLFFYFIILHIRKTWNSNTRLQRISKLFKMSMGGIILLAVLHTTFYFYTPKRFEHNYALFDKLIENTELVNERNKPILIVAHGGLAQYYEFKTGNEVLPWTPERRFSTDKVYRFVYGIKKELILHYLNNSSARARKDANQTMEQNIYTVSNNYIYIREDSWREFLSVMEFQYDEKLENSLNHWKNPMRVRPDFLIKK
ncbi:MAG: hypothetical protein ABUK01_15465 [Leptospirales bacterium]